VAGTALSGWGLFNFRSLPSGRPTDASDQARSLAEPVDVETEPDLYGVVKSIDVAHRTITLRVALEEVPEQEKTYDVAQDARVVLDRPSGLDELAAGTRIGLAFDAGGKAVVAIRSEPFRITARPKQQEVEFNKPFDVELLVVNASPVPQSFGVTSCSWDMHWKSSNPCISAVGWPCKMNVTRSVTLAPGEAYEKTLPMRATAAGQVSFRMEFTPLEHDKSFFLGRRTYWSPEVTLKVSEVRD
jgi:hypothetical protein